MCVPSCVHLVEVVGKKSECEIVQFLNKGRAEPFWGKNVMLKAIV